MNIKSKISGLREYTQILIHKGKNICLAVIDFVNKRDYFKTLLVFTFFITIFSCLYFSVNTISSGDDHFFHFRFAEEMRGKGMLESFRDFKMIYFSKMAQGNEYFMYYNFLFYIVLIPFTFIQPLFLAIKLYSVIAAALAFSIFFWCLLKLKIKNPFFWVSFLFCISGAGLIARFFTSRPFTLAPALMVLLIYFLHKKKYIPVFILSFIYLFWHSSTFFFAPLVIITYFVFEKFNGEKGDRWNLYAGIGGVAVSLGLVYLIAPDFLLFMYDTVFGIYKETILGKTVAIPEGAELYPADFFDFIRSNALLVCAFIVSSCIYIYQYINNRNNLDDSLKSETIQSRKNIFGTSFFLSILFFLGTVVASKRFEDFFVFFSYLFIAISFEEAVSFFVVNSKTFARALKAGVIICVVYLFSANLLSLQDVISNGAKPDGFQAMGEWVNKNIPENEIIFNASWNWFPQMYYYSPHYRYVSGLEPRMLYVYSPKLYFEWSHIGIDGYTCPEENCLSIAKQSALASRKKEFKEIWYQKEGDEIARVIKTDFESSYIVTSDSMTVLNNILDNNKKFEKSFESQNGLNIYHIKS